MPFAAEAIASTVKNAMVSARHAEYDDLRHLPKENKLKGVLTRSERLDTVKASR
jgi:hypothetical protein